MTIASRQSSIQVMLVDGNGPARERLVDVCTQAPDFAVVGLATTAREATDSIRLLQPAVAVLDAALWSGDVSAAIVELVTLAPTTRLVVLVPDRASFLACWLIQAGATSVVLRSTASETLLQIIRAAACGAGFVPREVLAPYSATAEPLPSLALPADVLLGLTAREREILRLMTQHHSTRAIADRLRISEEAVKTYWKRIKRKVPAVAQRVARAPDARPAVVPPHK